MNDPAARLQAQRAELGVKFIERTRAEAVTLMALIEQLTAGSDASKSATVQDLGYLVHRIHGGGATFGFDQLSQHAGEMEHLLHPAVRDGAPVSAETVQQLRDLARRLQEAALAGSSK